MPSLSLLSLSCLFKACLENAVEEMPAKVSLWNDDHSLANQLSTCSASDPELEQTFHGNYIQ